MKRACRWLDRKLYPNYTDRWDDSLFRERILTHIQGRRMDVLDVGAGAGIIPQMNFRGIARHVCGIDPDPRVSSNPYLDEGKVGVGEAIPYPAASFDLVFADNVLEHLEAPDVVFREIARVLRPLGVFLAKTPNKWHYMPTIARATPLGFHKWVNRLRGRRPDDTFPTRYRANTRADLHALAKNAGLGVVRTELIEGRPEYLRAFPVTYVMGCAYERAVNAIHIMEPFRVLLIAEFEKLALDYD